MKTISALCILSIAVGCLSSASESNPEKIIPVEQPVEDGIQFFHGSWEEALKKAEDEKKMIFLDAYAAWCGPCKMMAATSFKDKAVGEYFNENFINFKMDMEKDGNGPRLSAKFSVIAYPTLYFVDNEEVIIHTTMGMKDAAQLIEFGKTAITKKG